MRYRLRLSQEIGIDVHEDDVSAVAGEPSCHAIADALQLMGRGDTHGAILKAEYLPTARDHG